MGFEPMTSCLQDRRSNQLSYGALHEATMCFVIYLFIYLFILLIIYLFIYIVEYLLIIIIIIMHRLYSATLLRDPAALYSKSDINIKSIE